MDEGGDERGEPVVVAEADLVGGDRVVLVDDRDRAEVEQPAQRPIRVAILRAARDVVDGLYTDDPTVDARARKLDTVEAVTEDIARLARDRADRVSVGGMATKLQAARKAAAAGVPMIIASGREPGVLRRIVDGEPVGTYFAPKAARLGARKRWIAFAVPPQGWLTVDAGALDALTQRGKSLLPSGIVEVKGDFASGEVVALRGGTGGAEFARGVVNFDAAELRKIRGAKTQEIEQRLGYKSFDEVIHRDNLVIL